MESILFYTLAVISIMAAVALITRVSPLMSAVWLLICFLCIAGFFALLSAPFIAVLQVLVTAGAIVVLFLFVIVLMDLSEEARQQRVIKFGRALGAASALYLALVIVLAVLRSPPTPFPISGNVYESPATLASLLFSKYMVPFELAGVMLLVAAIAAVVLAKKRL